MSFLQLRVPPPWCPDRTFAHTLRSDVILHGDSHPCWEFPIKWLKMINQPHLYCPVPGTAQGNVHSNLVSTAVRPLRTCSCVACKPRAPPKGNALCQPKGSVALVKQQCLTHFHISPPSMSSPQCWRSRSDDTISARLWTDSFRCIGRAGPITLIECFFFCHFLFCSADLSAGIALFLGQAVDVCGVLFLWAECLKYYLKT